MKTIVATIFLITACNTGFSDVEVRGTAHLIRVEYGKKPGAWVTDVQLIRESPRKLIGFAKFKIEGMEFMHSCEATMGDERNILWQCKP